MDPTGYVQSLVVGVEPTRQEVEAALPADELIPCPAFTLNRGMTFPVAPKVLTGWILQIGKRSKARAGWYLPAIFERFLPRKNRALRHIDPNLAVVEGQEIHDWLSLGSTAMIKVKMLNLHENYVVFTGTRLGGWTWVLQWHETHAGGSRLVMRMRIRHFNRDWLKPFINYLEKLLICAPFHKGLIERLNS